MAEIEVLNIRNRSGVDPSTALTLGTPAPGTVWDARLRVVTDQPSIAVPLRLWVEDSADGGATWAFASGMTEAAVPGAPTAHSPDPLPRVGVEFGPELTYPRQARAMLEVVGSARVGVMGESVTITKQTV